MSNNPLRRAARSFVSDADTAPRQWLIKILWRSLATGIQTGGSISIMDQLVPAGEGPAVHMHPEDEGLYIASGIVEFHAGGKALSAGPGSLVSIPPHTEHSFQVREDARLINFYLPAGFENFIMSAGIPAERNELPSHDMLMPPREMMMQLARSYDGMPTTPERSTRSNPDCAAEPFMARANSSPSYRFEGAHWTVLADASRSGGNYCMFEVTVPEGGSISPHLRDGVDEAIYLLEGTAEVLLDDRVEKLTSGSLAFAPAGTLLALRALGAPVRMLVIHTQPGFERVIRGLGARRDNSLALAGTSNPVVSGEHQRRLFMDVGYRGIRPTVLSEWVHNTPIVA